MVHAVLSKYPRRKVNCKPKRYLQICCVMLPTRVVLVVIEGQNIRPRAVVDKVKLLAALTKVSALTPLVSADIGRILERAAVYYWLPGRPTRDRCVFSW